MKFNFSKFEISLVKRLWLSWKKKINSGRKDMSNN